MQFSKQNFIQWDQKCGETFTLPVFQYEVLQASFRYVSCNFFQSLTGIGLVANSSVSLFHNDYIEIVAEIQPAEYTKSR